MLIQDEPETRQKLGVFGGDSGQMIIEVVRGAQEHIRLTTFSPKDSRYNANAVQLDLAGAKDLKNFLTVLIKKANDLVETIPADRLAEDEILMKNLYVHYMVRRNKVDARVRIGPGTGVGVRLQLAEVRELHAILERVIADWQL